MLALMKKAGKIVTCRLIPLTVALPLAAFAFGCAKADNPHGTVMPLNFANGDAVTTAATETHVEYVNVPLADVAKLPEEIKAQLPKALRERVEAYAKGELKLPTPKIAEGDTELNVYKKGDEKCDADCYAKKGTVTRRRTVTNVSIPEDEMKRMESELDLGAENVAIRIETKASAGKPLYVGYHVEGQSDTAPNMIGVFEKVTTIDNIPNTKVIIAQRPSNFEQFAQFMQLRLSFGASVGYMYVDGLEGDETNINNSNQQQQGQKQGQKQDQEQCQSSYLESQNINNNRPTGRPNRGYDHKPRR